MFPAPDATQGSAAPPRDLRSDRPAADPRGSAGFHRTTPRRRPSRKSSTGCSPRPPTANAGAATGSIPRATPDTIGGDRNCEPERDYRYPYAWTYRDWVIKAFNDDMPYDQFIVQQLAADQAAEDHTEEIRGSRRSASSRSASAFNERERRHQRPHRRGEQGLPRPDRRRARAATITCSIRSRRRTTTRCTASSPSSSRRKSR